jgi:hypothetical protein
MLNKMEQSKRLFNDVSDECIETKTSTKRAKVAQNSNGSAREIESVKPFQTLGQKKVII